MEERHERDWAMGAHLMAFLGFVFPFGNLIGPLIIYLAKKEDSDFIADQARESFNFQVTVSIAVVVAAILVFIMIGALLLPIIAIANVIFIIFASLAAHKGERYRYPVCLRLLK